MKQYTTVKKQKHYGTQDYINANTGEIETMQVTSIEERDFNFHKVWMKNFINALDIVGNQKTRFCYWLIDKKLTRDNMLYGTQRQLADESGISLQTVNITLKLLMDNDFLRRQSSAVYMVNPDILYKGSMTSRLNLLTQYQQFEHVEMSAEEKLTNVLQSIDYLQKQAQRLQEQISRTNQVEQLPGQQEIIDTDMHMREVL